MLLKYLDIQGFKSFPDKTRVTFYKGLTAVVGPNGSGKSNISDAVRWVLGEQSTKTLRGSKMEDVIFTGTKNRKSQGFAEVSITVDNHKREFEIDSDEVTITRKYYRSGDSEYMINHGNGRLKDINEIFMDTGLGKDGYSLVGQGKISEIVSAKSNERREIFEEAAGISKFRYRKNESERSLTHAEENLVRLRDILSELEGRIEPLKEQSDKAKKFIELSENKKVIEVSIWNETIEHSNQLLKDQSDKIIVCTTKREEIDAQIEQVEADVQSTFKDMQQCLVEMEDKRKQKENLEGFISQIKSQIAVCENNILHNEENANRIDSEISAYTKDVENISNEMELKQNQINLIEEHILSLENDIILKQKELLIKTGESESFSKKQNDFSQQVNNLLLEQSQAKMTIAQIKMNIDDLTASIERNDFEFNARKIELEKYIKEQVSSEDFMIILNEKLQELNNSYSGHKIKLENRLNKLNIMKIECDKSDLLIKEKKQKVKLLEGLENNLEGFAYSVKEVIKRSKNGVLSGVYGAVSQLIDVKSEYSVAIETALGSAMQNIIVDNESNAKAAIRLLKEQNLGRATFLPITSLSGTVVNSQGFDRYSGYIDVASNLINYDNKFKPVIDSLLGRTVIVDDIDTAVLIAQKNGYKFRIVTLDGQVVNSGGSLTGGSRNKNQGFLSRKNDIQSLNDEVSMLSFKHSDNIKQMTSLQNEVSKIEAEFTAINSEILTLNEDKIRLESEQKRIAHMVNQITVSNTQMQDELKAKKDKFEYNNKYLEEKAHELQLIDKSISEVSNELNNLKLSTQGSIDVQTKLANDLSDLKIKVIEFKKDIESINFSIEEYKKRQTITDERTKELTDKRLEFLQSNENIKIEIEKLNIEIEQNKQNIISFENLIEQTMQSRQQLEAKATQLRKGEKELADEKEKISSQIVRLEERHFSIQKEYDDIIEKLWNEYEFTRSEAQAVAVKIDNVTKATADLNSIKSKIRNLGSVNVSAIEEYIEVSERYEFLNTQIKDAEKSRNELLRLINDLTQKMQDVFYENFNKINYHFQNIFVELFGGGKADLKLTDPDNLLESGIEIFVEPPGKIIKNLVSLSGGEQSFVAIAIYFAILKVRPAPFCILDEIEAALDDVNVTKYADYLHSMSDKTQFILITHRRGTMEAADVLYGVTMQEEGVSKLLQLKVSEIENNQLLNEVN